VAILQSNGYCQLYDNGKTRHKAMPVVGLSNSVHSVAISVHYIIKMSKRAWLHPICCECGHNTGYHILFSYMGVYIGVIL